MEKIREIPNSAFDIEYSTQWKNEVNFLTGRGIYYTYKKKDQQYGVTTYKYTKTVDLFVALADFYLKTKRNAKSKSKYHPKAEQLSFLDENGKLKEEMCADSCPIVFPDEPPLEINSSDDTE